MRYMRCTWDFFFYMILEIFSEYHEFTEVMEGMPTQRAKAFLENQFYSSCFYWKVMFQILSFSFRESILETYKGGRSNNQSL